MHSSATTQNLATCFETQLKQDVNSYYSANMAMVYSSNTPAVPPPWSNGPMPINGTDKYSEQYIFDPNNAYGFLEPANLSGIAIPDVQEAEALLLHCRSFGSPGHGCLCFHRAAVWRMFQLKFKLI